MRIEMYSTSPFHINSEEVQKVLVHAAELRESLLSANSAIFTSSNDEQALEVIKRFRSYRFNKKELKAKIAGLREKRIGINRYRSSGYPRRRL